MSSEKCTKVLNIENGNYIRCNDKVFKAGYCKEHHKGYIEYKKRF